MNKSEQINELATALSKAQSEIEGAKKDTQNPFFKSKYADLASVMDSIRGPFAKNGLSYTQTTTATEKDIMLETTLMHTSGQWITGTMPIFLKEQTAQAMGSAITYARRYALSAIAGVAQVDDDGNAASAPQPNPTKPGYPSANKGPESKY